MLDNQFAKKGEFRQDVGNLNNLLFNADKKSAEIVRQMNSELKKEQRKAQAQTKEKDDFLRPIAMEMSH